MRQTNRESKRNQRNKKGEKFYYHLIKLARVALYIKAEKY